MKSLVIVAVITVPALASADDTTAPPSTVAPTPPPTVAPTPPPTVAPAAPDASPFVTMFHHDGTTKVDVDVGYMFLKNNDATNPTRLFRADLFAQYVDPNSGLGGYATAPFVHASDGMTSTDSIGGLEIGGVFVRRIDASATSLVVHAGVVLPTVSDDNSGLTQVIAAVNRLPEVYATIPDAVTLRIGISPLYHAGPLFVRFDANLDVNLSAKNETSKPGFELDAGVGFSTGQFTMMAEVTNTVITGDTDSVTLDVGAISARFDLGKVKPYLAVTFPLDDDTRQIMNAGVTVGFSATP